MEVKETDTSAEAPSLLLVLGFNGVRFAIC